MAIEYIKHKSGYCYKISKEKSTRISEAEYKDAKKQKIGGAKPKRKPNPTTAPNVVALEGRIQVLLATATSKYSDYENKYYRNGDYGEYGNAPISEYTYVYDYVKDNMRGTGVDDAIIRDRVNRELFPHLYR